MEINYNINSITTNTSDIVLEINKKKYDYNKKIELVKKINKIKKKEYLLNILQIISTDTKDFTENNNGVFIFFHNLSDNVYEKLETYVNNIYKVHKKTTNILDIFNSEFDTSDNFLTNSSIDNKNSDNKLLSNKEKLILKRKKYEDYLALNQDIDI